MDQPFTMLNNTTKTKWRLDVVKRLNIMLRFQQHKEHSGQITASADQTTQLSCDVAIVGGGISGLYVAETLLRLHKETNVCLFERDDRFGGRIRDHTFQQLPDVPVSLGAWRIDDSNSLVWKLLKRFNISVSYLAKDRHDRLEARGVFATSRLTIKKKAFPFLNHGRFANATYEQMIRYLFSQRKEAAKFASLSAFLSEYLTPEGFQLFNHMVGSLPNYERQISARSIIDAITARSPFKDNFSRPESGLSTITKALETSATNLGAKLYKNEEIKVIEKIKGNKFKLMTTNYTATANKVVVAVPPKPMKHIKGSVAEKIQNDSTFQTIEYVVGFKGFNVFQEAWWQYNSTGSRYLADEQQMLSSSDCLGFTFPYKTRGPKGEAVLQTSYTSMGCAVKWGELLKISKESVDREMHRALKRLFPGVEIPTPLDSVYVYWDEGYMHTSRAGTHLSMFKVSEWAKRPFKGQDLFIVGEGYQPLKGWIEGTLQSAQNALSEGWGIAKIADFKKIKNMKQDRAINDDLDWMLFP